MRVSGRDYSVTAISYHYTVNDLQGLGLTGKGPFARPEWFALLEDSGTTPLLATAQAGDAVLAIPLRQAPESLEALTNWYAFTWTELSRGTVPAELYEALARDLAGRTHRVELTKLADEDGTATRIESAFRRVGWTVLREVSDSNHVLKLEGRNYGDYLAGRPGKLRTTLKRKARRVDIVLKRLFDEKDWTAYEHIYAQSWKPEEGDPALLKRFAKGESDAGRYLFGLALAEGVPVAAQFWTVDHGTAYIHKLAHLESHKQLSAGTTLTAALFEEVIDRDRVEWVDFGTGNDPYKADWMEIVRPRFRMTCLRASDPRNWPLLGKVWARKLVSRPGSG